MISDTSKSHFLSLAFILKCVYKKLLIRKIKMFKENQQTNYFFRRATVTELYMNFFYQFNNIPNIIGEDYLNQ